MKKVKFAQGGHCRLLKTAKSLGFLFFSFLFFLFFFFFKVGNTSSSFTGIFNLFFGIKEAAMP